MAYIDIKEKLHSMYENDDFDGIIDLIAKESEVDFDTALELSRAHINKANIDKSQALSLYENASDILDRFAQKGKDNPRWLFFKGYVLFKLNLVSEASIRFERALRFVTINDGALLNQITNLLNLCQSLEKRVNDTITKDDQDRLSGHIKEHFGDSKVLYEHDSVKVLDILPKDGHDYHVIMTQGLSAFCMDVPQGVDPLTNKRVELALILPKKWDMANDWPFKLLDMLILLVKSKQRFLGFGFSFDNEKPFSKSTHYHGAILTALGDYKKESQSLVLSDNSYVNFFQIVPLMPMEIAFRQKHSAIELLDLFKLRHVVLSPLVENRNDVCQSIELKKV